MFTPCESEMENVVPGLVRASHAPMLQSYRSCGACNLGLGHFGDDPDRLQAAARYLQQGLPEDETP